MRWPWRRKDDIEKEALREARRELERVRDQWPNVHEQAAESRMHKRRNHFGESIAKIYRGHA